MYGSPVNHLDLRYTTFITPHLPPSIIFVPTPSNVCDASCTVALPPVRHLMQLRRHSQRSDYTCRTFIEMDDVRDADDAVRALDGYKGWRVEISRNRGPPPGRGGFRGGPPVERFDDFRRSPPRRRSPSPYRRLSPPRRRSPSPLRRRSLSPRRRSLSPIRRRSPSPIRRRSPSPIRRRSPSPFRRSPSRRESPPFDRRPRSPSPIRERSASPLPRRSSLRGRSRSPGFVGRSRSRSQSPVRD
ncbi:hypothetical protein Vretifemale_18164 [Volvox reticuliferus]|uniref:RRM domain-containing protein n=3 Tax=Volvox reticuliferus TaxID=1737510 RepID=A0A8J4D2H6_9CHLO|nr:hypothetical protein Vretifemale_18164 [Volvox reticuliferus]